MSQIMWAVKAINGPMAQEWVRPTRTEAINAFLGYRANEPLWLRERRWRAWKRKGIRVVKVEVREVE